MELFFKIRKKAAKVPGLKKCYHAVANFCAFSKRKIRSAAFSNKLCDIKETHKELNSCDIIYVVGCTGGESSRYRVDNILRPFEEFGIKYKKIFSHEIYKLLLVSSKPVVFFRCAQFDKNIPLKYILKILKFKNNTLVYDVDDLVFDRNIVESIYGYQLLSEEKKEEYRKTVVAYNNFVKQCDIAISPTNYLSKKLGKIVDKSYVIQNSFNEEQFEVSNSELCKKIIKEKKSSQDFYIIYASGSNTHDKDFLECAKAICDILRNNKHVKFVIIGYLDIPEYFVEVKNQIIHKDFTDPLNLQLELAKAHVNIAPLEINEFNHSKSELKYFEAAIVETVTVASLTDTYKRCIINDENGMLAEKNRDWYTSILSLINNREKLNALAANARKSAIDSYSNRNVAKRAAEMLGLPIQYSLSGQPDLSHLHIAFVVPGLIRNGGGHRNIMRVAWELSKRGHLISLYFTNLDLPPQKIKSEVHKYFYPIAAEFHSYSGEMANQDIIVATHWTTVSVAKRHKNATRKIFYFVQDYEPYFAPMSSEYILAEQTYREGYYHICSGPWCEKILKEKYNADADNFLFPVNKEIYQPRPRKKTNRNLIFFAKPEMPRRCYEIGILALERFHALCPDVEIILFGSNKVKTVNLAFPATRLGVLPSIDDLAHLYTNADLGMVFSLTNPSLVPYEMMACGLPVVDLNINENKLNYGNREDIVFLGDPNPDALGHQIAELINDAADLSHRADQGLKFVGSFPTEQETGDIFEKLVINKMKSAYA